MNYIVIGALLAFFSIIENLRYNKWFSNLLLVTMCILLVFYAGLRDGSVVGTDSPAYFRNYQYGFWETEIGYKFLNTLFSRTLQLPYNVFLFFLNSISFFLIGKYLKLNTFLYGFPLLLYFSDFFQYYNISGIRQAMALSFTAFSIFYARERNYFKFFAIILLACCFHVTALIFGLAIIIPKRRFTFKNYLYFAGIVFIAFFVIGYLVESIPYLQQKFIFYSEQQNNSANIKVDYAVGIARRSIILILIIWFRKNLFKNANFIFYFNLYLVGFIIFIATYLISPDFGVRFGSYFIIADLILAGNMLFLCKKPHQKIIIATVFLLVSAYKLSGYMTLPSFQYKFFF